MSDKLFKVTYKCGHEGEVLLSERHRKNPDAARDEYSEIECIPCRLKHIPEPPFPPLVPDIQRHP
tara:strand:- start:2704 stop:2898 length:195 start_codon:yes stop_codon:yes gene_type:complete